MHEDKTNQYHKLPSQDYSITVKFSSSIDLKKVCKLLSSFNCIIMDSKNQNLVLPPSSSEPTKCQSQEDKLTKRELELLLYFAKGCSYSETAEILGCSISTIQTHVKHLYRKLNVNSKTEAVYEALQLELLDL
jgi:DNA-binding CsgD family transcriptional regulator